MRNTTTLLVKQINKSLDEFGVPTNEKERVIIFSKMLNISKQQAWNILEGYLIPKDELLDKIIIELEMEEIFKEEK